MVYVQGVSGGLSYIEPNCEYWSSSYTEHSHSEEVKFSEIETGKMCVYLIAGRLPYESTPGSKSH